MSAFSISAIDKLIQPCKEPASMEDLNERKPPFFYYPPLYATPPIEPQTPITPTSPSPYVVNFKRRGPVKRANAPGDDDLQCQDSLETDQIAVDEDAVTECTLPDGPEDATNVQMPERNPSLEFGVPGFCENTDMVGSAFGIEVEPLYAQGAPKRPVSWSGADFPFEKMIAQSANTRLEIPSDDGTNFVTGLESSRFVSPRTFTSAEEFFDAPETPLDDSASEDDASSSNLIPRMQGKSAEQAMLQLQQEMARRIRAEEAAASIQRCWNEMAKKCSLIGIPLASAEDELELRRRSAQGLYEQFSEKLVVARLVGGAVARVAVRAEKDEELQSMVARKNLEISRLCDKLQYVELVNWEMSQRNQEAIEIAQRRKQRYRKRQRWALGCFCSALCLGSAGLLCYKYVQWDKMEAWTRLLKGSTKIEPMPGDEACSS